MAQDFSFIPTSQLHPQWQQIVSPKQQAPAKPKYGGLAGALINNLPAIAGGIGMVGGEVLDPFGGGLLTGSLASGAGEALKQKLLGQSLSPKQIAIQAGETAALGGLGKGFSAARNGSKALMGADQAVNTSAGSKVGNFLVNKGGQEEASLGGYAVGQKVGGDKLGTAASNRIAKTLDEQGINGVSAKTAQAQIEAKLQQLNEARDSLYGVHNKAITPDDAKAVQKSVSDALSKSAGGTTPAVQNLAKTYTSEALNQGDLKGLAKYKSSIDNNLINWNRNPAAVEPGAQVAAGAVRDAVKNFLQTKVPGLAAVDTPYSHLSTANEALKTAAGRTANLSTSGGGLWGRILGGETAENAKGVYAKGLQATGKVLGGEAKTTTVTKGITDTAQPTPLAGVGGLNIGTDAAPSLGRLAAGSEAKAGVSAAANQALDAQTYNRLAGEYIQNLADQSAKRGTLLGASGNGGMLVKPGEVPSFASLGIEPKPIPSLTFAPKGSLLKTASGITPSIRGTETFDRLAREQALQQLTSQSGGVGLRSQVTGRTIAPILGRPGATATSIVKQAAGRGISSSLLMGGNTPAQQPADLAGALSSADTSGGQTDTSQADQPAITPDAYKQAVLADIQQTGGKHLTQLKSLYDQFGPQAPAALDATQQKEVSASVAAIGRIQQYGQQLDSLTKGANGNVASGTLSTILGKYDPLASSSQKQAAALQSSRRDVAIQLATALMGGNKPSAQSVDEIENSLPSVNDSPELRQNKLNAILTGLHENLKNYATPVSQITQSLGNGPTSNGDVGSQLSSVLAGLSQ